MGQGPDPAGAGSAAQFVELMRRLRLWADLSYRQLERNAADAGGFLPRATLSAALNRDELPREELLAAYVRACGGDEDTVSAWIEARRRLAVSGGAAPLPDPPAAAQSALPPGDDDTPQPARGDTQAAGQESELSAGPVAAPAGAGADLGAPQAPSPWRRRIPRRARAGAVVVACVLAGVLAVVLWPSGSGSQVRAESPRRTAAPSGAAPSTPSQPSGSSRATAGPSATAKAPESSAGHLTPTAPAPGAAHPPRSMPSTAPSTTPGKADSALPGKAPGAQRAAPRLPAAGPAHIHPASAPSQCLTEGRERNGRTDRPIAVQQSCAGAPVPAVSLAKVSAQVYRIQWYAPDPDKGLGCLEVDDASTSPGALLAPHGCTGADSQKFRLEAVAGGFRLRPVHSDLCIGFLPPVTDGAEAEQTGCAGTPDQVFTFTAG